MRMTGLRRLMISKKAVPRQMTVTEEMEGLRLPFKTYQTEQ
jgi:hypothetical protein